MADSIKFKIIKTHFPVLIQDAGRLNYLKNGVPMSGAMDMQSAAIANQLVGNTTDSPVLEITLPGTEIFVAEKCQIAITGGDFSPQINKRSIPMWETVTVEQASTLVFRKIKSGCRAYLAVNGRLELKPWLGSYSAFGELTPSFILKSGAELQVVQNDFIGKKIYPEKYRPAFKNTHKIRVTKGAEFDDFSKSEINFFLKTGFKIDPNSNRMGYLLKEGFNDFKQKKEMISSGILPGTIQVSNGGKLTILMRDAQTTGGYPRIANVLQEDLNKLAQMKAGDEIYFEIVYL